MKKKKNKSIPVNGMSVQSFVRGYKGQAQMNVNKIISGDISSHACRLIESLHEKPHEKHD